MVAYVTLLENSKMTRSEWKELGKKGLWPHPLEHCRWLLLSACDGSMSCVCD